VRQLGRGLASVRAASSAPLVARKVSIGAANIGEALGVVGLAWVMGRWWGNGATLSSGGGGEKWSRR
jgi:hypothetical protein